MTISTALILGVGPLHGLGAQLALRFARLGLHVVVAGRTQAKLDAVADAVRAAGGAASARVADATSAGEVAALFDSTEAIGALACAVYNAGNNTPGRIADMQADYFEAAWRLCCFGGFLFGREAAQRMTPRGRGTILFTGASASLRGKANFAAFAAGKAALRAFAQALAKEVGPAGIHVAHVVIDGAINGETIHTRMPEYAAKLGPAGLVELAAIAETYAWLHQQPSGGWSFEVDLRTAIESW